MSYYRVSRSFGYGRCGTAAVASFAWNDRISFSGRVCWLASSSACVARRSCLAGVIRLYYGYCGIPQHGGREAVSPTLVGLVTLLCSG